jgi:hypothetical protein
VTKFFLLIFTVFYLTDCFAQDTVERRNKLSDSVQERFHELKSKPGVKVGEYKAYFKRRVVVAFGNYNDGKRVGVWHFFNQAGRQLEKFNYDTKIFTFEGPLDRYSDYGFAFDENAGKTDTITRPLKVGGYYFGFIPYLTIFKLPFEVADMQTQTFSAYVELLISPGGRLAEYKVHVKSDYYKYDQTFNLDINLFDEADRVFIPAALNHKPILARIFIKCFINDDGGLDFY